MSQMLPGGGFAPDPRGNRGAGFGSQPPKPQTFPSQPMTQPPMGGFGGQPKPPGMGQQGFTSDMMQRLQQMQQMMPGRSGIGPTGQPLGEEGFGPAGQQPAPQQFQQQLGGMPSIGQGQQALQQLQQAGQQAAQQYQQAMRPPAMPQAPNRQQVGFESPRMQAMRNMQRRGGPNR